MTPEERLAQLEQELSNHFGCTTRYRNDVYERHGDTATIEQRIEIAEATLKVGCLGIAAHLYEWHRQMDLGRLD